MIVCLEGLSMRLIHKLEKILERTSNQCPYGSIGFIVLWRRSPSDIGYVYKGGWPPVYVPTATLRPITKEPCTSPTLAKARKMLERLASHPENPSARSAGNGDLKGEVVFFVNNHSRYFIYRDHVELLVQVDRRQAQDRQKKRTVKETDAVHV